MKTKNCDMDCPDAEHINGRLVCTATEGRGLTFLAPDAPIGSICPVWAESAEQRIAELELVVRRIREGQS